ncbi:MAG: dual specificity protein phosphatase family protein [Myxococcales bacterium]|nr:dual specificity protein phosphatase family protein [Myxococcales bacterium]
MHKHSLAGSGRPGLLRELEEDLEFIRESGFRMIVTLTQRALPEECDVEGIELVHFPIADMGIPMPRKLAPVCARILDSMARERPVLVHCRAGLGRTGVVLACCLVEEGERAVDAVRHLRTINRYYIQNALQERFVEHYERFVEKRDAEADSRPSELDAEDRNTEPARSSRRARDRGS